MVEIVASGSSGNAIVLNKNILIDCGVSAKKLNCQIKSIRLILLTHAHGDHFKPTTIHKIMRLSPRSRIAFAPHMKPVIESARLPENRVDMLEHGTMYDYGICQVTPFNLPHNIPNAGWKIILPNKKKVFYATDASNLDNVSAKNFDLYLIEANHETDEILERIRKKEEAGQYSYEVSAMKNHLSKEKADRWLMENMGSNSEYIYLHEHHDHHSQNPVIRGR